MIQVNRLIPVVVAGALSVMAFNAFAGELDNPPAGIPQGLIVRDDGQGNQEVFKADVAKVTDEASAAAAVAASVKPANQITDIKTVDELDQTTSQGAWYNVRGAFRGGYFGGAFVHGAYAPFYSYAYPYAYAAAVASAYAYYYPYYTATYAGYPYTYYAYSPYYYPYYVYP